MGGLGLMRNKGFPIRCSRPILVWSTPLLIMIEGQELLDFVHENEGRKLSEAELAREAGYVRVTKTGKEQVLSKRFTSALLAAKGLEISIGRAPGKVPQYYTHVHASGVILLGKTYSQEFGLQPGDELDIRMEDDCIRLVPKLATATPAKAKAA